MLLNRIHISTQLLNNNKDFNLDKINFDSLYMVKLVYSARASARLALKIYFFVHLYAMSEKIAKFNPPGAKPKIRMSLPPSLRHFPSPFSKKGGILYADWPIISSRGGSIVASVKALRQRDLIFHPLHVILWELCRFVF